MACVERVRYSQAGIPRREAGVLERHADTRIPEDGWVEVSGHEGDFRRR